MVFPQYSYSIPIVFLGYCHIITIILLRSSHAVPMVLLEFSHNIPRAFSRHFFHSSRAPKAETSLRVQHRNIIKITSKKRPKKSSKIDQKGDPGDPLDPPWKRIRNLSANSPAQGRILEPKAPPRETQNPRFCEKIAKMEQQKRVWNRDLKIHRQSEISGTSRPL